MSLCVPCLAPRSPDPAPHCLARVTGHVRSSKQPGSLREDARGEPHLARLVRLRSPEGPRLPWARTGLGGPEPRKPSEWCPPPRPRPHCDRHGFCTGTPGGRWPVRTQKVWKPMRKGLPALWQSENPTFCFCGVRPSQHTLRTGLVKPPRSRVGVRRIPCLTKVQGPFQSTQGLWQGAKANTLPGRIGCRGAAPTGAGQESMEGHGFCPDAWSWVI